jgi:hypothetical protein
MNREYYVTPKAGWIMRQFWKAAGGDRNILERATYADQMKYMCLGGIVIATGVMAGLAGGYAFYTIFEPRGAAIDYSFDLKTSILSIIFGVIWGLIIFNIDRFIVTSTGKGDGTEAITWQELKSAIPRIIMGAIIALTISKPVEIRMFKTEIDARLYEEQLKLQKEYETRTKANFEDRIKLVDGDLAKVEQQRDDLYKRIKDYEAQYRKETAEGMGGRGQGEGPVAKALKREQEKLEAQLADFDRANASKIAEIENKRKSVLNEQEKVLNNNVKVANGLDGLLERIKLAHEIAGWTISIFITLLFMAIELTPIFFKLMLVKTPYDYLEENVKEYIKALHGIEVRYDYYKDKQGQERHLVIHHSANQIINQQRSITAAQMLLTRYALQKYVEAQKKKIDDNPSDFVKVEENELLSVMEQVAKDTDGFSQLPINKS